MSLQRETEFIEIEGAGWFWVVEDGHAPKDAWDWREYASCRGPFATQAETDADCMRRNGNTGGYSTGRLTAGQVLADPVLKGLVEKALGRALEVPPRPSVPQDCLHHVAMGGSMILVDALPEGRKSAFRGSMIEAVWDHYGPAVAGLLERSGHPAAARLVSEGQGGKREIVALVARGGTRGGQMPQALLSWSAVRDAEGVTLHVEDTWSDPQAGEGGPDLLWRTIEAHARHKAETAFPGDPVRVERRDRPAPEDAAGDMSP